MKGDFSRSTFDRRHRFSRVLMQQGRVLLDSDQNERDSILLHYLRTLAADLIGRHGGPGPGFEIQCHGPDHADLVCDFTIGWGRYYVDGILVENDRPFACPPSRASEPVRYGTQPDYPLTDEDALEHGARYLVYLDVWERHLTHLEVDHIREVALGGPDTSTRARVVWQVKVVDEDKCGHDEGANCEELLRRWVEERPRCLRARARVPEATDDPCITPPEARYRGAENQLYRVEIHDGGEAADAKHGATFKWSRENGSVVFGIRGIQGATVELDTLGPDVRRSLKEGDWVEVLDDRHVLRGEPGVIVRVDAVDSVTFEVTLHVPEGAALPSLDLARHPLVRRWDQGAEAIPVREGKWIDLEDGVQVFFEPEGGYRTGDYWVIPARTATGDVLWPTEALEDRTPGPQALPPHGIEHHYAPLARISLDANGVVTCEDDCRCVFEPHCAPADRLDNLYFHADSEEMVDGMERIRAANAEILSAELGASHHVEARLVGYAPREEGEGLALRRAEVVLAGYVEAGIEPGRVSIAAELDDATLPVEARRRVETRVAHTAPAPGPAPAPPAPRPPSEEVRMTEAERVVALARIDNVGATRARRLVSAGHDSPTAVAALSVDDIRTVLGVGETLAERIREHAGVIAREGR